jgi:tetratricopeptide (TPR) repeat protein
LSDGGCGACCSGGSIRRPVAVRRGRRDRGRRSPWAFCKSRSLFEALAYCAHDGELEFVAPVDAAALRSLLTPGQGLGRRAGRAVLWLDDLEPFLNEGVTLAILREWHAGGCGRIVAATYGGKGREWIAGSDVSGLTTIASDVLQHAREITLGATTDRELAALRARLSTGELAAVERHGLAAYLVAGPALERKLSTAVHATGEDPCPEGVAVVHVAVGWARCGRIDPIPEATLRDLWPTYLPAGVRATDERFDAAVAWALRPVAGTIALLQHTGSYRAFDYVVRLVRDKPGAELPRDASWTAAIDTAMDAQALAVGTAAYRHARLEEAMDAFARARESSVDGVASLAGCNLGAVLGELDRSEEAVAVYDEVVARYGDASEPALREQVAGALVNKGVALGALGRSDEELVVYDDVVARYGDAPEPALREQVAGSSRARDLPGGGDRGRHHGQGRRRRRGPRRAPATAPPAGGPARCGRRAAGGLRRCRSAA